MQPTQVISICWENILKLNKNVNELINCFVANNKHIYIFVFHCQIGWIVTCPLIKLFTSFNTLPPSTHGCFEDASGKMTVKTFDITKGGVSFACAGLSGLC